MWASHSFDDVSHPPKASLSNHGAYLLCPGLSPEHDQLYTYTPKLTPIHHAHRSRVRQIPIWCIDRQELVSLLREERLLERTGPISLRTQSPEEYLWRWGP